MCAREGHQMSKLLTYSFMFALLGLVSGCASASDDSGGAETADLGEESIGSTSEAVSICVVGQTRWVYNGCCIRGTAQKEQRCAPPSVPGGLPYWKDTGAKRCSGTSCPR